MLLSNRKAYTLSQFIIVCVLGVLLIILIYQNLGRYRSTIEAREAEVFMQKVRSEQEDRCAVGRKYAVYQNHLKSFYKNDAATQAFRYDLSNGYGITATHKMHDFRLQMPSYADGRICCNNCQKLNRYYSPCEVLKKRKDFVHAEPECMFYATEKKEKVADLKKENSAAVSTEQTREPVEKSMNSTQGQPTQTETGSSETSSAQETPAGSTLKDQVADEPQSRTQRM